MKKKKRSLRSGFLKKITIGTNAQPSILSRRFSSVKTQLLFYTPMSSLCSSLQSVLTLLWIVLHTTWLCAFKSLSAFQPQSLYLEQNSCSQPLTCSECVWVYVCICVFMQLYVVAEANNNISLVWVLVDEDCVLRGERDWSNTLERSTRIRTKFLYHWINMSTCWVENVHVSLLLLR